MTITSRVFDNHMHAREAVRELERIGVPSSDISIVANQSVTERYGSDDETSGASSGAGVGATLGGGAGLLAGLGVLAIPGLGPVVAAGWLASTAVGAVAGSLAGGLLGALVDAGSSEDDAHVYSEAVRRGGTLVTVRSNFDADQIKAVLDRYEPVDTRARRADYESSGWTSFDPNAPPYIETEADRERNRQKYG
jgi:hypothetical protein